MQDLIARVARRRGRKLWLALPATALVLAVSPLAVSLGAQSSPAARPQSGGGLPDLVGGLKQVQGCLGVETARTAGGKNVIFAWFEDKAACLRWYYSDVHEQAQSALFPERTGDHKPLQDVPDEVGPILAIASMTPADPASPEARSSPFSQIAIELYTPLKGGLHIGGTFAPAGLVVPKRKVIVDEE